jgi:hypothetical protein
MNKPYNIQNMNICNGIFHISFFKALLINEGEPENMGLCLIFASILCILNEFEIKI